MPCGNASLLAMPCLPIKAGTTSPHTSAPTLPNVTHGRQGRRTSSMHRWQHSILNPPPPCPPAALHPPPTPTDRHLSAEPPAPSQHPGPTGPVFNLPRNLARLHSSPGLRDIF
ncbi:unnamed protein product [Arctogadus glacialis]